MIRTLPFALLLLTLALAGCNKNKKAEVVEPPPADPYATDAGFQPVQVSPAATYVEPAPAAPAMGGNSYTIQKGDTLWSIARRHYGDGKRWQDIVAANPGLDPQRLPVGKTIALP